MTSFLRYNFVFPFYLEIGFGHIERCDNLLFENECRSVPESFLPRFLFARESEGKRNENLHCRH